MNLVHLAYWLVIAHLLCDYPLQVDFLSKAKNHRNPIPEVPWYTALLSHAAIQGAGVAFVTGSLALGVVETMAHTIIDYGKCDGWYGFNVDQCLHLACKALWIFALAVGLIAMAAPAHAESFSFLLTEICDSRQCYPNPAPCSPCAEGTPTTVVLGPFTGGTTQENLAACQLGRENLGRTIQGSGILRQPDTCFSLRSGGAK